MGHQVEVAREVLYNIYMNEIQNSDGDKLSFLIEEDSDYVKSVSFDNGKRIEGDFILRIYRQRNGKITASVSMKNSTKDYIEEIFLYEKNLEDEKNVYALLDVTKAINS